MLQNELKKKNHLLGLHANIDTNIIHSVFFVPPGHPEIYQGMTLWKEETNSRWYSARVQVMVQELAWRGGGAFLGERILYLNP